MIFITLVMMIDTLLIYDKYTYKYYSSILIDINEWEV